MSSQETKDNSIFNIESIYNVSQGNLLNGVEKLKNYNFVSYIGGDNNGSSQVVVNTSNSCIYYLLIKYVSYEPNLSFKININNIQDNKVYYAEFSSQWSINAPLTCTIPVFLNNGKNIIEFYGNENNKAPYLGEFIVASPPTTKDLSKGIIENNAYIDSNTRFVNAVGGPRDGSVLVTVNVSSKEMYNLVFSYICGAASRILKIDINGIDSNNTYTILSSGGWNLNNVQNFTVPINLNSGNNTIKFHGDGINYSPNLGSILVKSISNITTSIFASSKTYKVSSGTLGNGASINKSNIVTNIGGSDDGYAIVKFPVNVLGDYLIKLNYSNGIKPLKIDVNGIEVNTIYNLPKKSGTLSVTFPLVVGINQLKFHGNGIDYTADLESFSVELSKNNTSKTSMGIVSNNASILKNGVVTGLGGDDDGMYSIQYITKQVGWYDLYVTVDTSKAVFLMLDINIDYKDLFYNIPKSDTATVYIIPLFLEKGINNFTFHGDSLNNAPDILDLDIKFRKAIKDNIYNFVDGVLENGSVVNLNQTVVENLGGIDNGSVTLKVNVTNKNLYDLNIIYIGESISRTLKIDVIFNGEITTSTICILPGSSLNEFNQFESFKVKLSLVKGINNIKFYGNGIDSIPNLKEVRISEALIKDSKSFSKTYELTEAEFFYGAIVDKRVAGFISAIGGSKNGRARIDVNVPRASEYEIKVKYLAIKDNEKCTIGVNNILGDNWITCPKTNSLKKEDAKTITITTFLEENSSLSFNGANDNKDLLLGSCTITKTTLTSSNSIKITSVNLYNGAKKFTDSNFITLIGGPKNGKVEILVDTFSYGVYDLGFKYICASNERVLNVTVKTEIREYNNSYKIPLTENWEVLSAQTFTVPVILRHGSNIVILEGDGYNFAPIIGKFNFAINTDSSITTYDTSAGIFKNGAKVNSYGLVTNIGGPENGEVSVKVSVSKEGNYDLIIEYKPIYKFKNPNLEVIIKDSIYYMEKEKEREIWSLTDMPTLKARVNLSRGENIITFRGLNSNINNEYAVFLGKFTLFNNKYLNTTVKKLSKGSYDLTKGKLENGANVFQNFIVNLGGISNGSVTIKVKVEAADRYIMRIYYKALEDSSLLFDINGEETGNVYFFQKTNCYIDIDEFEINLNNGENSIKFYGNTYMQSPNLSIISIE